MSITLTQRAFIKPVLHSLKFPFSSVIGVLLGSVQGHAAGEESEEGEHDEEQQRVIVDDAVPLFHSHLLLPMLELALHQVEAYAAARGQQVVGLYAANERMEAMELSPAARRVGDTIASHCPAACCLLMDAKAVQQFLSSRADVPSASSTTSSSSGSRSSDSRSSTQGAPARDTDGIVPDMPHGRVEPHQLFKLYAYDSAKVCRFQKPEGGARRLLVRPVAGAGVLVEYVGEQRQERLWDFEDHLDDAARDWRNEDLME